MQKKKLRVKTFDLSDASALALCKMLEYAGLAAFLLFLPRNLGPHLYGELALVLTTLAIAWMIVSIGAVISFGRLVPELVELSQLDSVKQMFTQYYLARAVVGLILVLAVYALLRILLPATASSTILMVCCTFIAGTLSMTCFEVFYGFGRVGVWLIRESIRRLLVVALYLVFADGPSLEGMVWSLLLAEILLCVLGHAFAHKFFLFDKSLGDLRSFNKYLQLGFSYFAANILFLLIWRTGELILGSINVTTTEIAYFSIAVSIVLALTSLFGQLLTALIPTLSKFHSESESHRADYWLGVSLRYLTILSFYAIFGYLAFGDALMHFLIGPEFSGTYPIISILIAAVLPMNVIRVAMTSSVLEKNRFRNFLLGFAGLTVYLASFYTYAYQFGGRGIAMAMVAGVLASAGVALKVFPIREIVKASGFGKLSLIGIVLVIAVLFSPFSITISGIIGALIFSAIAASLGMIQLSELKNIVYRR